MNVATISECTFYHHTSSYHNAVVIQQWKEHQQDLINEFLEKNNELILAGDGCCYSPGYSAKFGSFTLIGKRVNSGRFSAGSGLKLSHVMVESFKAMG